MEDVGRGEVEHAIAVAPDDERRCHQPLSCVFERRDAPTQLVEDLHVERVAGDLLGGEKALDRRGYERRPLHHEADHLRELGFGAGEQRNSFAALDANESFARLGAGHVGGVQQPQAVHFLGKTQRVVTRDEAAHRVAAEVCAPDTEGLQERVQPLDLRLNAVPHAVQTAALTEPGRVPGDHAIAAREEQRNERPVVLVGADAVQQDERLAFAAFEIGDAKPGNRHATRPQSRRGATRRDDGGRRSIREEEVRRDQQRGDEDECEEDRHELKATGNDSRSLSHSR